MNITRLGIALLLSLIASTVIAQEESEVPESPSGTMQFLTIHSDGEAIKQVTTEVIEGAPMIEQSYAVKIPYIEGGVTRVRTETRVRTIMPTRQILTAVETPTKFYTLSGEEVARKDMVSQIPMTGQQVVVWKGHVDEMPEVWKEILKEDVVIMCIPPKP